MRLAKAVQSKILLFLVFQYYKAKFIRETIWNESQASKENTLDPPVVPIAKMFFRNKLLTLYYL